MSDVYLVEVEGLDAGLVARDRDGFRFHAALPRFYALDGRLYADPSAATRAARRLLRERGRAPAPERRRRTAN